MERYTGEQKIAIAETFQGMTTERFSDILPQLRLMHSVGEYHNDEPHSSFARDQREKGLAAIKENDRFLERQGALALRLKIDARDEHGLISEDDMNAAMKLTDYLLEKTAGTTLQKDVLNAGIELVPLFRELPFASGVDRAEQLTSTLIDANSDIEIHEKLYLERFKNAQTYVVNIKELGPEKPVAVLRKLSIDNKRTPRLMQMEDMIDKAIIEITAQDPQPCDNFLQKFAKSRAKPIELTV